MFLYIVPLKQGLKQKDKKELFLENLFLYIVPLKQGLKQQSFHTFMEMIKVFIHSSIKTRIETDSTANIQAFVNGFYT